MVRGHAYGNRMQCRAVSTPGDGGPARRSRRLQIAEARLAAEYIERARLWAADLDQVIADELMALRTRVLEQAGCLEQFEVDDQ